MKVLNSGFAANRQPGAHLMPDPLASLLADANAGDPRSLGRVLEGVAPAVLSVVRVILGAGNPEIPDVAQESLIAVKDALRSFRGEASVTQYARQIAVRTALSSRRRRGARDRLLERYRREGDADAAFGAASVDPVERGRRTAAFRGLLDDLPDEQAETFALRVVLDYSLEQVAEATGVPLNTVRSRVRLAREKLRKRIEGDPVLMEILRGDS